MVAGGRERGRAGRLDDGDVRRRCRVVLDAARSRAGSLGVVVVASTARRRCSCRARRSARTASCVAASDSARTTSVRARISCERALDLARSLERHEDVARRARRRRRPRSPMPPHARTADATGDDGERRRRRATDLDADRAVGEPARREPGPGGARRRTVMAVLQEECARRWRVGANRRHGAPVRRCSHEERRAAGTHVDRDSTACRDRRKRLVGDRFRDCRLGAILDMCRTGRTTGWRPVSGRRPVAGASRC